MSDDLKTPGGAAAAGDTSAEMLIRAALPLLDKVLGMWLVGRDDKRLVRALRDALAGPEGVQIATMIARYYNPYGTEDGPDKTGWAP